MPVLQHSSYHLIKVLVTGRMCFKSKDLAFQCPEETQLELEEVNLVYIYHRVTLSNLLPHSPACASCLGIVNAFSLHIP